MTPKTLLGLLKDTFWQWYDDNTFLHGAALAFYTAFAIAPVVISAALAAMTQFLSGTRLGDAVFVWHGVNWLVDFGLITLLFAMIYKLLPDAEIDWNDVWVGAAVTALLFNLGKYLIGLYLGQ